MYICNLKWHLWFKVMMIFELLNNMSVIFRCDLSHLVEVSVCLTQASAVWYWGQSRGNSLHCTLYHL